MSSLKTPLSLFFFVSWRNSSGSCAEELCGVWLVSLPCLLCWAWQLPVSWSSSCRLYTVAKKKLCRQGKEIIIVNNKRKGWLHCQPSDELYTGRRCSGEEQHVCVARSRFISAGVSFFLRSPPIRFHVRTSLCLSERILIVALLQLLLLYRRRHGQAKLDNSRD